MNAKKLLTIIGISLLTVTLVTTWVWAFANRERPKTAQFGLLIDYSDSRIINCRALDSMLQEVMSSPNLMPNSNLYVFSTGDDKTSDEPVLLGKYLIPVNVRALEGQSKAERERQDFISRVKTRCEKEPVKKRSPILLGIKRVIENLKTNGCDAKTGCKIFVQTDGQELGETSVKQSLEASSVSNSKPKLLISNEGFNIKICGFAQITEVKNQKDRRSIQAADKTLAVWKQIFTEPDSIIFQPHCQ
jgi:hypothetical protein